MNRFAWLLLVTTFMLAACGTSCRPATPPTAPEEAPATTEEYVKRGNAYADKGEFDRAIADLNKAIESTKKPKLITTGFLRAKRSTVFAVKSCGRDQPLWAMTAAIPIGSALSVSLLIKRGTIVVLEMKLKPNIKLAVSIRLTPKFQR